MGGGQSPSWPLAEGQPTAQKEREGGDPGVSRQRPRTGAGSGRLWQRRSPWGRDAWSQPGGQHTGTGLSESRAAAEGNCGGELRLRPLGEAERGCYVKLWESLPCFTEDYVKHR